jgi:hypothetical protein
VDCCAKEGLRQRRRGLRDCCAKEGLRRRRHGLRAGRGARQRQNHPGVHAYIRHLSSSKDLLNLYN